MKAVKLISPLVALLLITVFFAGCISSTAAPNVTTNSTLTGSPTTTRSAGQAATVGDGTPINTKIDASVDKPDVKTGEQFKINGTLVNSSSNKGIPEQVVNLDRWNDVTQTYVYTGVRTFTDADGNYTLIRSESVAGTYNYSANFTGFANYKANHSFPDVTVNVTSRVPTNVTLLVDNPNPFSSQTFNLSGLLKNKSSGEGIPDARVDLQSSLDNKIWSTASAPTKTANGTLDRGTYGFAGAITGNGTVYFRAFYGGNDTYEPSYSPTVVVNILKPATNMADFRVSNTNPITNQALYFAGHLNTTQTATNPSKALAGQLVYLEVSGEGVYWQQVSDPFVTDGAGLFAFTGILKDSGTYYFRAHFFGTDDARESVSPIVTVKVTSSTAMLPSDLSILASPPNPIEGQRVFIYGMATSKETNPVPFANAKVYLEWSSDKVLWSRASSSPAVTNAQGVYAFAGSLTKGTYYFRTYYGGDAKYQATYSSPLQTVCTGDKPTTLSLIADNVTPTVGQSVNFTATLKDGVTPLHSENVTIYHYLNNVRVDDTTNTTDANGNITLTKSLNSPGQYSYSAIFTGDDTYASSNSSVVNINVQGGAWAGWSTIGGQLASGTGPAVCAQDANSLYVFVQGTDNALWYTHYQSGSWSSWKSLGGGLTSSPAAVSRPNGKIDVFVRGTDNALWTRATTNGGTSWSAWSKIGGQLLSGTGPAAYAWGDTRIGWFVTGTDNALFHMWKDSAGTHNWQSLGGVLTASPATTSSASGVIDVFARGTDNALKQREYANNAWYGWTSLGGQIASGSGPAACSWGAGRLDVFVQGTDSATWHTSFSSAWSGWQSIGGAPTSSPSAASRSSGTIDVFARGTDGNVWWKYLSNPGV